MRRAPRSTPWPRPAGPVSWPSTSSRPTFTPLAARFFDGLRTGAYDGHLEASTAVRLASTWRFALGMVPLEAYQVEHGKVGTPGVVLEDLAIALSRAIDELTRPIDAIKHQAKTVTVGISRSDETLLQVPLVREVMASGASRDRLTYSTLRTLSALEPMVAEVRGYTRYAIEGRVEVNDAADEATVVVVDRGGIGRELRSRTEEDPRLRGTKRWVAVERTVLVAKGRSDGRTVIIVPEVKDGQPTGLALLHVDLRSDLPLPVLRAVSAGLSQPLLGDQERRDRDRTDVPRRPAHRSRHRRSHDRAGQRPGRSLAIMRRRPTVSATRGSSS